MEDLNPKIKSVLETYPETKHSRIHFAWQWGVEYYGFNTVLGAITKANFLEFMKNWNGAEREYRRILKEPNYSLPPSLEVNRREKELEFIKKYGKIRLQWI